MSTYHKYVVKRCYVPIPRGFAYIMQSTVVIEGKASILSAVLLGLGLWRVPILAQSAFIIAKQSAKESRYGREAFI